MARRDDMVLPGQRGAGGNPARGALLGVLAGLLTAGAPAQDRPPSLGAGSALPPDELVVAIEVPRGGAFGTVAEAWALPVADVVAAAKPHHDLARIRPDRELQVVLRDGEALPVGLRYGVDDDHALIVERGGDLWTARLEATPWVSELVRLSFPIEGSLWLAGEAAGLRPMDLIRLAEVFEFEVDFNSELHRGDHVGLVAQRLSAEGVPSRLGAIHAVRLSQAARAWELVYFTPEDGEPRYFHSDGRPAERQFLRSPLEFSRVTSGFNPRRFHPVLKTRRPHNGTDFGAPTGTPVRAVSSGRVVTAGTNGGHGRYVEIAHDDVWRTSYSHLSAVLVKPGQHVAQGDLVGRVGSTGLSTGPHLHYQMWRGGKLVDAMRVDLPDGRPLSEADRPAFAVQAAYWMPEVPLPGALLPTASATAAN